MIGARITDTLIGVAIVMTAGYLLWPDRSDHRTRSHLAQAFCDTAAYAERITPATPAAVEARSTARRRAYRSLSETRTALQHAMTEPPPVSTRAAALHPLPPSLDQALQALTVTATRLDHGAAPPPPPPPPRSPSDSSAFPSAVLSPTPPSTSKPPSGFRRRRGREPGRPGPLRAAGPPYGPSSDRSVPVLSLVGNRRLRSARCGKFAHAGRRRCRKGAGGGHRGRLPDPTEPSRSALVIGSRQRPHRAENGGTP
ncbi:FUSC family protein [Streptomyces sp. NPDC099050]|uniref:FUSC family protein n=1 Tax=Streptomyces sp. NPDC099050 TaxID=3366100 RepID=UPI0038248802